ncbi:MAG: hypothetical protein ACREIA_15120 [Opitutaceae bacterium]
MTPEQRALFRLNLLQQLDAAGAIGMPVARLELGARVARFEPAGEALRDELQYLEDAATAARIPQLLSPEMPRWRITKAGRDLLAAEGLA